MRHRWLVLIPFALITTGVPAAAQDTWGNAAVMAGQSAVLNEMNEENTRRVHRENGLPPPDFKAGQRRLAEREARNRRVGAPPTSASKAQQCAFIRANLHRLQASQVATYRRHCQ